MIRFISIMWCFLINCKNVCILDNNISLDNVIFVISKRHEINIPQEDLIC
jgi:hypothetical protein